MRKSNLLLIAAGFVVAFLAFGIQSAHAQGGKPAENAAKPAVPVPVVPFCDEAIPKVKAQLQTQADANCKTAQSCVHCVERESKTELYATLIVQPQKPSCKRITNLAVAPSESVKGQAAAIHFDVAQSVCTRSGVSLEVLLPDASARASDYSYEWTIDGKQAGRKATLECACGETASIKVTQNSTKQSLTKTMTLPVACLPEAKSRQ